VANRYHALHAQATLRQQQLWFLKARDAEAELARVQAEGREAVNRLEGRTADLRRMEDVIEVLVDANPEGYLRDVLRALAGLAGQMGRATARGNVAQDVEAELERLDEGEEGPKRRKREEDREAIRERRMQENRRKAAELRAGAGEAAGDPAGHRLAEHPRQLQHPRAAGHREDVDSRIGRRGGDDRPFRVFPMDSPQQPFSALYTSNRFMVFGILKMPAKGSVKDWASVVFFFSFLKASISSGGNSFVEKTVYITADKKAKPPT
jgi:hypothetical protein